MSYLYMDRKNTLQSLFDKYLRQDCSPGELADLMEKLQEEDAKAALNSQMKEVWEGLKTSEKKHAVNWDRMYDRIIAHPVKRQKGRKNRLKLWTKAAAAAAIFAVAGSILLWHNDQDQAKLTAKTATSSPFAKKEDIVPGGNKAVLTLSNGKKIVLNKVAAGNLARQNGTSIIKVDSNLLAYQKRTAPGNTKAAYNTLATPRGGQFQLALPDGTKVWLNAASSIRFPTTFAGNKREVALTGEAYFEVARNPGKPFIVNTEKMKVKVLGTHFNIHAYPDEPAIKTTLLEGSVSISSKTEKHLAIRMHPGEQVNISKDGKMKLISNADVEEAIGWKNGLFVFHNDELQTVMHRLARWYDVKVTFANGKIPSSHFTGSVRRKEQISKILQMLELTGGADFRIEKKEIIVSL